ncbi:hypothetical protein J4453_03235, partial [Candidatus Woesearchaeota archaeon]|nr:hypothetical protein [Candidatus Woesearchaeota archaeon]
RMRKTLDKFTDDDYIRLVKMTNTQKVRDILETHSRDRPSALVLKLIMKQPRYMGFAKTLFR